MAIPRVWEKGEVCSGECCREEQDSSSGGEVFITTQAFLAQLRLVKSTYYRWVRWEAKVELEDRKGGSRLP